MIFKVEYTESKTYVAIIQAGSKGEVNEWMNDADNRKVVSDTCEVRKTVNAFIVGVPAFSKANEPELDFDLWE